MEPPTVYNLGLGASRIPLPGPELCACVRARACLCGHECTLKGRPKVLSLCFLFAPSSLPNRPEVSLDQTSSAGTSGTGDEGSGRVLGGEGEAAAEAGE